MAASCDRARAPSSTRAPAPTAAPGHSSWRMRDLADIRGLALPRLALEVAVTGGHPLLVHGPPQCGKGMLLRRIAGLLPKLDEATEAELVEILAAAAPSWRPMVEGPAVRMPHYTVSLAGMLGGGQPPRPGEVNLAHGGVLVLDELPEFPRSCLEGVRAAFDASSTVVVRHHQRHEWPARFLLVGTMTECPCGWRDHPERACMDHPAAIARYQGRGRCLEGVWDLAVRVRPLSEVESYGDSSAVVRARIEAARRRRAARGGRALPFAEGVELNEEAEAERLRRVATTLADLGHAASTEELTEDGLELARSLFELPSAPE